MNPGQLLAGERHSHLSHCSGMGSITKCGTFALDGVRSRDLVPLSLLGVAHRRSRGDLRRPWQLIHLEGLKGLAHRNPPESGSPPIPLYTGGLPHSDSPSSLSSGLEAQSSQNISWVLPSPSLLPTLPSTCGLFLFLFLFFASSSCLFLFLFVSPLPSLLILHLPSHTLKRGRWG